MKGSKPNNKFEGTQTSPSKRKTCQPYNKLKKSGLIKLG
jgi:hypothetical protein